MRVAKFVIFSEQPNNYFIVRFVFAKTSSAKRDCFLVCLAWVVIDKQDKGILGGGVFWWGWNVE
jgi:hypothetical protein